MKEKLISEESRKKCDRIKEFRLEKKLSQPELARMIGTSQSVISDIENYWQEPSKNLILKM